jgi:Meiotically up-regulated gene 113
VTNLYGKRTKTGSPVTKTRSAESLARSEARRWNNKARKSRRTARPNVKSLLPARITHVYLFGCPQLNYYKIGISQKPATRLRDLNVPFVMEILSACPLPNSANAIQVEARVHQEFADRRIHREWFRDITLPEFESAVAKVTSGNVTECNTTLE